MAIALAASACGAKEEQKPPSEPTIAEQAAEQQVEAAKPTPPRPAAAAPKAGRGQGDACEAYRKIVEKLAACGGDAMPQATRDAIKANFERDWSSWDKMDGSDRARRDEVCESAVESIQLAASEACGW